MYCILFCFYKYSWVLLWDAAKLSEKMLVLWRLSFNLFKGGLEQLCLGINFPHNWDFFFFFFEYSTQCPGKLRFLHHCWWEYEACLVLCEFKHCSFSSFQVIPFPLDLSDLFTYMHWSVSCWDWRLPFAMFSSPISGYSLCIIYLPWSPQNPSSSSLSTA